MSPVNCQLQACTRRHFLHNTGTGIGSIALSSLLGHSANRTAAASEHSLQPHFTPRTKNIIYLHMAGSPPQHELFDYKPKLVEHHLQPCPQSQLENPRFALRVRGTSRICWHRLRRSHVCSGWRRRSPGCTRSSG